MSELMPSGHSLDDVVKRHVELFGDDRAQPSVDFAHPTGRKIGVQFFTNPATSVHNMPVAISQRNQLGQDTSLLDIQFNLHADEAGRLHARAFSRDAVTMEAKSLDDAVSERLAVALLDSVYSVQLFAPDEASRQHYTEELHRTLEQELLGASVELVPLRDY